MKTELNREANPRERLHIFILAGIQIIHILDFVIMMPLGATFIRVFGISPVEFSSLVSAYTISAGILSILSAPYADRFNRKSFLLFNFLGFLFGTFMCAQADGFTSLLVGRLIAGAFGGILNACVLSFVADLIPFHRRGAAMGVVMSAFSMASVAGVPIGLWIANSYNWNAAFYFIVLIGFILWAISFILLPSIKASGEANLKKSLIEFKNIISQKLYLQSFLLTGCLALGIFMIVPFIGPYLVNNVGLLETDLPYIYLAGGSGTIVTARIVGKLSDRYGCYNVFKNIIYISIIPILLMTSLKPLPLGLVLLVTSLFTMFASTRLIPAMTLISGVVSPKERGAFMSLENSGRHLSSGLASQIGGFIIGTTVDGKLTNYLVIGIICIILSFLAISIAKVIDLNFKLKTKHL